MWQLLRLSLFSPEIWPEQAGKWYEQFSRYYWQEAWTASGFREFPKDMPGFDWYFDVDAGPVLKGYGFAACAFGVGAARVNGHFEHAYPMTTEMFVASWPLADGTLLVPRLLSNATDAPYLGEAAILYILTRLPAENTVIKTGGSIPRFTLIVLALQLGVGLALVTIPFLSLRRWMKQRAALVAPFPRVQVGVWVCFLLATVILLAIGKILFAVIVLLFAQLIPRYSKQCATAAGEQGGA